LTEEIVAPNLTDFQQWEATPEASPASAGKVETAPASEPEVVQEAAKGGDEDEDDKDLPKGLKKRFRKLTGKIRDLETQLAQKPSAAAEPEQAKPEAKPAVATPPGKPQLASFETYEDFVEALADWKAEQREQKKAQVEKTKQSQTEWQKRIADAKTRYEDWDEVVNEATDVPVTPHMQQTIFEMEHGPDVVHYLASNPEEAKRISKLSPLSQARELGKIEDKVAASEEPPEKKPAVSRAPRPAKVVSGSSANDLGKEPDPSDFAKWSKWKDRKEAHDRGD
jgi:hypothetical protein